MEKIINKQKAMFIVLILLLVVMAEYVLESNHLPTWPAMMCMIFFFTVHLNIKEAPAILLGGAFGLLNLFIIKAWYGLTVPWLGGNLSQITSPETVEAMFASKLIYIVLFVAVLLLFEAVVHWVFNSYAFMFFLIAGLVSTANSTIAIAANTVSGAALTVVSAGGNTAVIDAVKAAAGKAVAGVVPATSIWQWLGIELIGGGLIIAAMIGIIKLVARVFGAPAHEAPPHDA